MSDTLQIILDETPYPARPGMRITGTLRVHVKKTTRCKGLSFGLVWRTEGKGYGVEEWHERMTMFEGEWAPGQYSFPFAVTVPDGPFSYVGKYMQVVWYLEARADIAMGLDWKQATPLQVEPDLTRHVPISSVWHQHGSEVFPTDTRAWRFKLGTISVFLGIAFMLILSRFTKPPGEQLSLGFDIALTLGATAPFALVWLHSIMGPRKMGTALVQHAPRAAPGEVLPVTLRLRPDNTLRLNKLTVALVCKERTDTGSGKSRRVSEQELYRREHVTLRGAEISPGAGHSETIQLTIPDDAAPSFGNRQNDLVWFIETHADIPMWPDWNKSTQLLVIPGPAATA